MPSNLTLLKGTLLGVLFFCSFPVLAQNWQDLQWQRLLLYRETLFGYQSEADAPSFFAHKEGKTSPAKELSAFLKSVEFQSPDPKENVFCRFPARVRWLKKFRSLPGPQVICDEYQKYRNMLKAKSISVVFSSYYLNNPGSSFGHTFLRLGKNVSEAENSTATELLDTGINYGAMTEGAGPVLFAIGGLAGWFYGSYNAVPYYYKVREYNDYETRDLWSYQLDMTQEEIDMVVDVIWELAHTKFDYFFLTENCSYHVLSILEAARPSLQLHAFMPRLYTIPSETLKALMAEKIVKEVSFRPSASTQFYHQLAGLNPAEKTAVSEIAFGGDLSLGKISDKKKALIYDTAISLVDYKFAKEILKGEEEAQKIKRPLLVARSKIPVRSDILSFDYLMKKAPHLGHGQKRLAISYLQSGAKNVLDTEWRFAFHDFLDRASGFPPRTRLEIIKGQLRTDGQHFQLRDFSLLDVMTIGQWDSFNRPASWKVKLGQTQTRYDKKDFATTGFTGGYGYGLNLGFLAPYVLLHLESAYISERLQKFKFAYGADIGILMDLSENLKALTLLEARAYPWEESRSVNEVRYSTQSFGFGAFTNIWLKDGVKETGLRFFKYL